ncbi:uncharacterized protein LY89DRAFT_779890 [Mollisia scopiformis]|uniref:Myb-like domain-containing protein n=1 Tax=Mollisia scopiformis TaxID=149040 RepID=A0A194XIG9_MOLSC|nr:uncharacterized protein LY89DRAFT_779890 [Mollisia scopiformis]KUJ20025.1 hypothetical protein LY89DRAFT_779890 [Mollisia scopiformis]
MPTNNTKKKIELSFTNWVLGGNLISVVEAKSKSSKNGMTTDRATARKMYLVNEDGTQEIADESLIPSKGKRVGKKARIEVTTKTETKEECDIPEAKAPETYEKWCEKCKTPCCEGAVAGAVPAGAKTALCECGKYHWICQYEAYDADTEKEKGDEEKKSGGGKKKKDEEKGKDVEVVVDAVVEEKSDDKKEDGVKDKDNSDEKTATSDEWTAEQDKTILEMKADNKSWKEIVAAVGSSKQAVVNRFKELKKAETEQPSKPAAEETTDKNDNKVIDDAFGADLFAGDENDNGGGSHEKDDAEIIAGLETLLDGFNDNEDKATKKGNKKNKGKKQQANAADPNTSSFDNNQGTNSPAQDPLGISFGPQLYGKLVPDATWSKDDCDLLEHLLERYESEKWLHMQANFYNWTGRMVAAEFIERKFKTDASDSSSK